MQNRCFQYGGVLNTLASLMFAGIAHGDWFFRAAEERIDLFAEKLVQALSLDDRQRRVLQGIAAAFNAKIAHMKDGREQMRSRAVAMVEQERIAGEDVLNLVVEHRQKSDIIAAFAADQFVRFHNVLRTEQRAILAQLIDHDPPQRAPLALRAVA